MKPARTVTVDLCTHRWRIEEANGRFSRGTCQHCGAVREDFINSARSDWEATALPWAKTHHRQQGAA